VIMIRASPTLTVNTPTSRAPRKGLRISVVRARFAALMAMASQCEWPVVHAFVSITRLTGMSLNVLKA